MIKHRLIDGNILELSYFDIVKLEDIQKLMQETLSVATSLAGSGKPFAVLTDLRVIEDMTPDARDFYAQILAQYKNIKQQVSVIVFTDRHNPVIRWMQEALLKGQTQFSNYYTDYNKALSFVREKLKQLGSA